MNWSTRSPKPSLLVAAALTGVTPPCTSLAQEPFHITFGTTGYPDSHFADDVGFIVESDSGDIVVAGTGASFFSDDRGGLSYPLIARVRADGELVWQRVYKELENQSVVGLLAVGEDQFVLLREALTRSAPRGLTTAVSLRRVSQSGDVSESLGTLGGFSTLEPFPVKGGQPYFLIVGSRVVPLPSLSRDVRLFRLDLQGNTVELASVPGSGSLVNVAYPGGEELLLSRWHSVADGPVGATRNEVTRVRLSGDTETAFTIDHRLCGSIAASLTRVFCVEHEWPQREATSEILVSYSLTGQVLWRRVLEPGVFVRVMRTVDSGGLIYSHIDGIDTIVTRRSQSGDVLWTQRLRSTGPRVFLRTIEQLRDQRLALLGSTGSFGAFVSTDTNAMLMVTEIADGDLGAPVVSTIVNSAGAR